MEEVEEVEEGKLPLNFNDLSLEDQLNIVNQMETQAKAVLTAAEVAREAAKSHDLATFKAVKSHDLPISAADDAYKKYLAADKALSKAHQRLNILTALSLSLTRKASPEKQLAESNAHVTRLIAALSNM